MCEIAGQVVPLEAKAGINPKSKSLASYDKQMDPAVLGRTNLLGLKRDGKVINIPLYAISQLSRLLT